MKRFLVLALLVSGFQMGAQNHSELLKHFEAYYKQMNMQGDTQGIINGLTHLIVLQPSQARKDTLSYIYMSEGRNIEALNAIGSIESMPTDSDIAVQVKAVSLKALRQPKRALEHFEELFKRDSDPLIAYELAELNMQLQDYAEAEKHVIYGLANSKADMKKAYYEQQQPYEVSLKSAFMYLNALVVYNKDTKANIDAAVDILDAALKESPNFNLIQITKSELLRQKQLLQAPAAPQPEK
ncbi:tetratricopeptide repeat protein [Mariniflexile ostreae]|uniref:Tetratricopeptide repeat protein n=1 Tax=Mariniflexile ostreae TaxID=1520892 RepID=A0ABV5F9D3_9FLAO